MSENSSHLTTGESPAKILFGTHLKTSLDLMFSSVANIVEAKRFTKTYFMFNTNNCFVEGQRVWFSDYRANKPQWCAGEVTKVMGRRTYLIKTDCRMVWNSHSNQLKNNCNKKILTNPAKSIVKQCPAIQQLVDSVQVENDSFYINKEVELDSSGDMIAEESVTSAGDQGGPPPLRRRSRLKPPDKLIM